MSQKPGTKLGLIALPLAIAVFLGWFALNNRVGVPENRIPFVLAFLSVAGLGFGAFVRGTRWYGGLAALVAIFIGLLIPFTVAISRQEVAPGAIAVGDTIPRFEATDEFGNLFDSESLHGHLLLIKFFRAHW